MDLQLSKFLKESSSILDALQGKNEGPPPIWIMRQAGRYLPEYRALRSEYPFETLMETPELAKEVTLLPIKRYDLDAAILFSDILTVCRRVGGHVAFVEGKGPVVDFDLEQLSIRAGEESLFFVKEAIELVKPELHVPLIGFAGAPFTVASYLIEGGSVGELKKVKTLIAESPAKYHRLLESLTEITISYLQMQIDAGVDVIQLFDTWAGKLSYSAFKDFILPYNQKIFSALKEQVPTLFYSRGTGSHLPLIQEMGSTGVSLDYTIDLPHARQFFGKEKVLQGNLDPAFLFGSKSAIQNEVKKVLSPMNGDPAYIFNFGQGITPDVRPEAVEWIIEAVKSSYEN